MIVVTAYLEIVPRMIRVQVGFNAGTLSSAGQALDKAGKTTLREIVNLRVGWSLVWSTVSSKEEHSAHM